MLTVGLLSDIHAHRHDQADEVQALIAHVNATLPPDLLVLAGDISHRTPEVTGFLKKLTIPCARCWVPGNHDIWVIDSEGPADTPEHRYRERFPALSADVGWHYLPAEPLLLKSERVAVVGTLGWFTGDGYSEWLDADAGPENDKLAKGFATALADQIERVPRDFGLIVVTHHLSHSNVPANDPSQGRLANRYLQPVLQDNRRRILLAVHGHRHVRYNPIEIDGIQFVAHPFGYPHQHARVEDGYRLVEIAT